MFPMKTKKFRLLSKQIIQTSSNCFKAENQKKIQLLIKQITPKSSDSFQADKRIIKVKPIKLLFPFERKTKRISRKRQSLCFLII